MKIYTISGAHMNRLKDRGRREMAFPATCLQIVEMHARIMDRLFVRQGSIATAVGCLAAVDPSPSRITQKVGEEACDVASVRLVLSP